MGKQQYITVNGEPANERTVVYHFARARSFSLPYSSYMTAASYDILSGNAHVSLCVNINVAHCVNHSLGQNQIYWEFQNFLYPNGFPVCPRGWVHSISESTVLAKRNLGGEWRDQMWVFDHWPKFSRWSCIKKDRRQEDQIRDYYLLAGLEIARYDRRDDMTEWISMFKIWWMIGSSYWGERMKDGFLIPD